jgi:1,4-alpha-glucan branching enzyme
MRNLDYAQEIKEKFETHKHDPHGVLGLHSVDQHTKVIRLWRPGADSIYLEVFGKMVSAEKVDPSGLFEYRVPAHASALDYKVYHQNGLLAHDPYSFSPTFGEMDSYLFSRGVHYKLYEVLGARVCEHQGSKGVKFAVWAPSASAVSLVGDFNFWDGRVNPMRSMGGSGVWEIFIPGIGSGEKYKFEIRTQHKTVRAKADPFAYWSELRPATASVVFDVDQHEWKDKEWIQKRISGHLNKPMAIYEVHLGSWKGQGFTNYKDIAHELVVYCQEMGFTHVELMPIAEHPLDESWGYQVSGFFSVTSRYGTPADFQYFVDYLHQHEIGVILDWVVAHFPTDDFSLAQFDGSYLFEHSDPRKGYHPHWNTYIFNYGRFEVSNFLIANALFWMDKMHIDGLRVDAVASMLYLDYGMKEGEWIPNCYGGRENLEAMEFLKHLNSVVHERFPKVLMIAEESTAFTGVTHPLEWGGLGFDMKWNMGWMNDTLRYFKVDPFFRHYHHNELTFGLLYAFSERFLLVFSHDEVVHGKGSLLSKMPGDDWQKFANVRLLYSYMMCQPGKKLLFMGGEIGQWAEWHCKEQVHWHLLEYPLHKGLQKMIKDLNHFYQTSSPLWELDFEGRGFEWIDFSDRKNSVISYLRKGDRSYLACVHNFTPSYFSDYFIGLQNVAEIKEVFSTDREEYGGSGKVNRNISIHKDEKGKILGFSICLAPLSTMIFEVKFVS